MTSRALILVNDPAEKRRDRVPGALLPALARRDIDPHIVSLVGEPHTALDLAAYDLLVVMGSHESVNDPRVPWLAEELRLAATAVERGMPSIGSCFGGQLLARVRNGRVARSRYPERGLTAVASDDSDLVPEGPWMQLHSDIFTMGPGAIEVARNASGPQAFVAGNVLGVQFHPETTVDSFDSWVERWAATGSLPDGGDGGPDVDALRREIAEHEQHTIRACDRLVDTFCARHL
ncbi:type 1 glutamine amidotransferase [Streptomyces flaveolus]|uniref:type 1 glutamine amidotransferase n=1 Tax=Streptomyces flaveolus TaxID=67297 RepID=UPI0033FB0620